MTQLPLLVNPDYNSEVLSAYRRRKEKYERDNSRHERSDYSPVFADVDCLAHFERVRGVRK